MRHIVVDVETDGPAPHLYSMISLGAVCLEDPSQTFYGEFRPISENYLPAALGVSGFTREETMAFPLAKYTMHEFNRWVHSIKGDDRVLFVSDNAGFDWQFVNYYFHRYCDGNPFGFSPMSITWMYKGFARTAKASFKHLRDTKHTHNALDDAKGNAEALRKIVDKGFKL